MNNYFTPTIEDLRIGYECELKMEPSWCLPFWINTVIESVEGLNKVSHRISDELCRTPFLYPDQIEKEGWVYDSELKSYGKEINGQWYLLKAGHVIVNGEIIKSPLSICRLFSKDPFYIYVGQCRDINQFRNIIKYLGL